MTWGKDPQLLNLITPFQKVGTAVPRPTTPFAPQEPPRPTMRTTSAMVATPGKTTRVVDSSPVATIRLFKYPGAKHRLLEHLLPHVPDTMATYFEPFTGSAALYFALVAGAQSGKPPFSHAVLADLNEEVVVCLEAVRDSVDEVIEHLRGLRFAEDEFESVRKQEPNTLSRTRRAARFIYLTRTCRNGVWRVNGSGQFNVGMGKYDNPAILKEDTLRSASAALAGADVVHADFADVLQRARAGDFAYVDPPYDGGFMEYTKEKFRYPDQVRLAAAVREAADRGVQVLVSNSDTPLVRELYAGFEMQEITVSRSVSFTVKSRREVTELLLWRSSRASGSRRAREG